MFRSTYAEPDVPTFVELQFEYDGKQYLVRRSPKQERPRARGTGFATQDPKASLQIGDEAPITALKDVNAKLVEILGVDFSQYSQIAMIAQGQFRELLLANTKERGGIFRSIFKTNGYLNLQNKLQEEANALYGEVQNKRRSAVQYVDGAVCSENSEHAVELKVAKEKVNNNEMTISEMVDLINIILSDEKQLKEKLENEQKSLQSKIDDIQKQLDAEKTYKENKQKHDEATKERERRETEEKPTLDKNLDEAKKHQPEIDQLAKEITLMEQTMPKYSNLTQTIRELSQTEKNIKTNHTEIENAGKAHEELKADIEKKQKEQ
jgi:exonuclease SbcC